MSNQVDLNSITVSTQWGVAMSGWGLGGDRDIEVVAP